MKRQPFALFALLLIVSRLALAQDAAAPVDTTAVVHEAGEASLAWLHLIDEGSVEASWEAASAPFRNAVSVDAWKQAVQQARGPFEPFGERQLVSSTYSTEIPQVPGEWVILDYSTKTAASDVIERVSLLREDDGVWRCGGYYVRPVQ